MKNLPPEAYIDPDIFQSEQERLFSGSWQLVAQSGQLPNPGDYLAGDIAGTPFFVLRGKDGELRAFRNVCRHRGAQLLQPGTGTCRTLKCPYHQWVYSDSGNLEHAPWFGEPDEIVLKDWPLLPLPLREWRGLVFAVLSETVPLEKQLGDTIDELSDTPIESYSHFHTEILEFDANWKIYTDNFVEGYHIPGIHPGFYQAIDFNKFETTAHNGLVRMTAPPRRDLFYQGRWYWMWPNWTLSLFDGGMNTSRINPSSASRTQLIYNFYFASSSDSTSEKRDEIIRQNIEVVREDFAVCLGTHQNYQCRSYSSGPLSPKHEKGVHYFQQRWKEHLG